MECDHATCDKTADELVRLGPGGTYRRYCDDHAKAIQARHRDLYERLRRL